MTGFLVGIGGATGRIGWPGSYARTTPDPPPAASDPTTNQGGTDPIIVGGEGALTFSSSSYGNPIPLIFGSDKVSGNVIWSSPIETVSAEIGNNLYFYRRLNFCLAIAEGPISGVLRIWMGDKLIYNTLMTVDGSNNPVATSGGYIAGGVIDVTDVDSPLRGIPAIDTRTTLHIFNGSETQTPHGVMFEEEGYANTPAYRGTAYIMFQNFIVTNSSMPSLQVEIAANATTTFPRNGNTPEGSVLTTLSTKNLLYDYGNNIAYYSALGAGTLAGYIAVQGDTLDQLSELEIYDSFVSDTASSVALQNATITPSGYIVVHSGTANNGYIQCIHPFAQVGVSTLGPGPGFTVDDTGFPSIINDMHSFRMNGADGLPRDYVAICNGAGGDNAIGLVELDDLGALSMGPYTELPKSYTKVHHANFGATGVSQIGKFADGKKAYGDFLFFASGDGVSETTSLTLGRIEIAPNAGGTALELTRTDMKVLSLADLEGLGQAHVVTDIMHDLGDGNLLIFISTVGSSPLDWIVKWNPRTNGTVWKSRVNHYPTSSMPYSERARIGGGYFSWIASDNSVQTIDLNTGYVSQIVDSLSADQSLPNNNAGGTQFYNGADESITYLSTGTTKINKFWVSKTGLVTTSLQTVIKTLLARVGVDAADVNVSDFVDLDIRGYTVKDVTSIRDVFTDLRKAFTYEIVESNGRLLYVSRGASSTATIPSKHLADNDGEGSYLAVVHNNDISRLRKLNLTYRDIDREYTTNVQSVYIPEVNQVGFDSDAAIDVSVPVVLNSTEARYLADKLLYAKRVGEEQFTFTTSFQYAYLDPGDVITVNVDLDATKSVNLRIISMKVGTDFRISIQAVLEDGDIYNDDPEMTGVEGRYNSSGFSRPDPLLKPYIIPIPANHPDDFEIQNDRMFTFYTVLNPTQTSTSPADFKTVVRYGENAPFYNPTPSTTYPTWGYLRALPADIINPFTPQIFGSIQIKVMNENTAFALTSVAAMDDLYDDVDGAANLCVVGRELLQFQTVTDDGDGLYTLSGLVRGRYGTERHVNSHVSGEVFILLRDDAGVEDSSSISKYAITNNYKKGALAAYMDVQTRNPKQYPTYGYWTALTQMPFDVPEVRISYNGGTLAYDLEWDRRSRRDADMPDDGAESDVDVLDQDQLEYYVIINDSEGSVDPGNASTYLRKENVVGTTTFSYTSAMQTADGFDFATDTIYVWVYQVSSELGEDLIEAASFSLGPQ